MELARTAISGSGEGRVRLAGEVRYDDSRAAEWYWFDAPAGVGDCLSRSGNPWLAALLPLAVTLNQPLRIPLPVDARLVRQARQLVQVWRAWYPGLATWDDGMLVVEAEGERGPVRGESGPRRAAAFFSGGVDSFFTVLRPRDPGDDPPIEELLSVWGFDVPIERPDAAVRLRGRHEQVARELGVAFTDVTTNLRTTRWRECDWGRLAHGCALGAVALVLEPRYSDVLIAATGGFRDLHPWGSHPLTDPLLSTTRLRIVHDGAGFTRVEKSRLLAAKAVAMRSLRVCWRSESDVNCERCGKCYRAMLILELLGALERCETFATNEVDVASVERVLCAHPWDFRESRDIHALAVSVGRRDVARAVERAMDRSRRLQSHLDRLRPWRARSLVGPAARRLERRLLRGWIE